MEILSDNFYIQDRADVFPEKYMAPQRIDYLWTPLHVAAQRGDDVLVTILLANGAEIDSAQHAVDKYANPYLLPRTKEPYVPITRPKPRSQVATPLYFAIRAGHKSTARLLLGRGASTVVSSGGITALHLAAWCGDLELCRLLLDESPCKDVDSRTGAQLTPFHYAVAGGHLQTVDRFLLERGADIQAQFEKDQLDIDGYFYAFSSRHGNAFTHTLWAQKHSDALMLLEIDPNFAATAPEIPWLHPVEECLVSSRVERSDDRQALLSFLRRLRLRSHNYTKITGKWFERYFTLALSRDLPEFLKLLLEDTEAQALSLPSIDHWLNDAINLARSNDAVDAVMALIQYGVSKQDMPLPRLSRMFPPPTTYTIVGLDYSQRISPGAKSEAGLAIAKLLYQRLLAEPEGISHKDLHDALLGACQAGGLKMCEWLASLSAVRLMDKKDLVIMLNEAARGGDHLLTDWVLTQSESAGDKASVMSEIPLREMIRRSGGNETALVLASHGVHVDVALIDEKPPNAEGILALFSCRTRQRMTIQDYHSIHFGMNVFFIACSRPDIPDAVELCRLAIRAAGDGAKELVNCNFLSGYTDTLTPISLLCRTEYPLEYSERLRYTSPEERRPRRTNADDEPARLAMLQMVLDAGAAEVHTLAEVVNRRGGKDFAEPSESLWHALASEDTSEIARQQAFSSGPIRSPMWRVHNWKEDPIRCAIQAGFPSLVQTILKARPLPTRNHPAALRYLEAACGGYHGLQRSFVRLSLDILRTVLTMGKLDHADFLLPKGETALMTLLESYGRHGSCEIHRCRCESDILGPETEDLSNMVRLLLLHGAKWKTRSPMSGKSTLDKLRALRLKQAVRYGLTEYKHHNLTRLGKHIVLDLNSPAACSSDSFLDFNPFEMGNIRATEGSC